MSNVGRVMTVRLTIVDSEAAEWLWNAHRNPINGVTISALSNGDMFKERDMLANAACFYIREEGETTQDAIDAHFGEAFQNPDDAARDADGNVSPGAKWDVIDYRGNVVRSGGP